MRDVPHDTVNQMQSSAHVEGDVVPVTKPKVPIAAAMVLTRSERIITIDINARISL